MTYAIERLLDSIEEKGRKEIVKNAIKRGMKLQDIAKLTGLTVESVERI